MTTHLYRALIGIAALSGTLLLSSCATTVHGSRQRISVTTSPVVWTQVTVLEPSGRVYSTCHTPCHLDLERNQEYTVRFEKYGYEPVEIRILRKVSDWVGGNLVTGAVAGLIVDYASGSIYKLTPDQIQVTMSKTNPSSAEIEVLDGILTLDAGELTTAQRERWRVPFSPHAAPGR